MLRIVIAGLTVILLILLILHSTTHIIPLFAIKILLWPTVLLLVIHYALKGKNKRKQ